MKNKHIERMRKLAKKDMVRGVTYTRTHTVALDNFLNTSMVITQTYRDSKRLFLLKTEERIVHHR